MDSFKKERIHIIEIEEIHDSLVNGRRKQMVKQIKEYGLYDFWFAYRDYLAYNIQSLEVCFDYFADAVISFHRITSR